MTTPYITVADANSYFDERLNSSVWENATDADKLKSLQMATRSINNLQYLGAKSVSSQENEFPRLSQSVVPNEIKEATCEIAICFLDDVDIEEEVRSIPMDSAKFSGAQSGWSRDFVLTHLRNGIPSSEAWARLMPYLSDPLSISIARKTTTGGFVTDVWYN